MSDQAQAYRTKAREKAERLVRGSNGPIDASGWREPLGEMGEVQTGPRPVSVRQGFRRGGKVPGHAGVAHYGRKPRASGGKAIADALMNRDVKQANELRSGPKHVGGMAQGGAAHWIAGAIKHPGALHKELGVPSGEKIPTKKLSAAADKGGKLGKRARLAETLKGFHHKASGGATYNGTRPAGGRLARKGGGRAKKGMNVNIIVAPAQSPRPMMPPPGAPPAPPGGPLGLHQGAPPPMPPPGSGMPPAGAGPPMMRKSGGKVGNHALAKPGAYPIEHAGGGARGRLEKIKAYGANAKA